MRGSLLCLVVVLRSTWVGLPSTKQWEENRVRKAQLLKSQLQKEEESELKLKPQLNPRSVKLALQDTRRRHGDVADHLYAQAERQRVERLERREQQLADEVLGYPAITRQAAVLVRDQDIADRLYVVCVVKSLSPRALASFTAARTVLTLCCVCGCWWRADGGAREQVQPRRGAATQTTGGHRQGG